MDCNRDEALRAKGIAEEKLASQDFVGAKKFAQRAQQLFPALENISQMIAVIDVHLASLVKVGTDKDWYRILQIDPTADDAQVKKQYKRLALFLHPDKNKSIGAEAAFKLIGEASQVLSDRTKRMRHDTNRARTSHGASAGQNVQSSHCNGQSHRANPKTFNRVNEQHFSMHSQQTVRQPAPPPPLPTFWTACTSCRMRYQYLRTYENQYLLCPHCRRPFIAKELISNVQANNAMFGWPPHAGFRHGHFNSSNGFGGGFESFNGFTNGNQPGLFQNYSGYAGKFTTSEPGADAKFAADHVKSYNKTAAPEKAEAEKELLRKQELGKHKETDKDLTREENKQQKRSRTAEKAKEQVDKLTVTKEPTVKFPHKEKNRGKKQGSNSSSDAEDDEDESWEKRNEEQRMQGSGNPKVCPRRSSRSKRDVTYKADESDEDFQEIPPSKKARVGVDGGSLTQEQAGFQNEDMMKKLANLAKNAIRMKLKLQMGNPLGVSLGEDLKGKERDAPAVDGLGIGSSLGMRVDKISSTDSKINTELKSGGSGKVSSTTKSPEKKMKEAEGHNFVQGTSAAVTYSVPDADFHNFDKGREEGDIKVGQIWALYDDKEGMPRYYIKVKEVHSYNPFKVTIAWLELRKPSEEHCELLDLGFSFTCGEFRISSSQVMDSVNAFSHMVVWEKGGIKGIVKVYPRKGDVWGLYRDWEPGQRLVKAGDALLKYVMVAVLSDFDENSGVSVVLLSKMEGFKTLFQISNESVLQVPSLEVLRFSHYVPSHKLKGDEAPLVREGCWELDPASVPMSLIYPDANVEKAR